MGKGVYLSLQWDSPSPGCGGGHQHLGQGSDGACGDGYGAGVPVRTAVTGEARILQPRSSERGVVTQ